MNHLAEEILNFWFGSTNLAKPLEKRQVWFRSTPEFDLEIKDRFTETHKRASEGKLDFLKGMPGEYLSLIIILDQFPRNIYRGTPKAYVSDPKALEISSLALDLGYDAEFGLRQKIFTYLPFEHSENLEHQERALSLFMKLGDDNSKNSAQGHFDAIKKFGRFPHRNKILGRLNTPEEEEYMKNPPMWGKTAAEAKELERTQQKNQTKT